MFEKLLPIFAAILGTVFTLFGIYELDGYVAWIDVAVLIIGTQLIAMAFRSTVNHFKYQQAINSYRDCND